MRLFLKLNSLVIFVLLMTTITVSADTQFGGVPLLTTGNHRFIVGTLTHPHQTQARREEVAKGQYPMAAILSCADSRVPPELIFDMGLGDLFVVRVAGNIVNDDVLGSLEYAVEHLHVGLVVVLGHTGCGAVKAAVAGKPTHTHIDSLIESITPAVEKARSQQGDLAHNCERTNVQQSVQALQDDYAVLGEAVKAGKLQIKGAIYDLKSGKVDWLH